MCFREFKLKFLVIFLLLVFPFFAKADCNDEQRKFLQKLLKTNGVETISIGGIFAKDNECTFVVSSPSGSGKIHTSYIYNGEDRFTKMLRHGVEIYYSTYQINNQIKRYERNYVFGSIEGLETNYYSNGKVSSEATYKNDLLNGIKTSWNENGIKISENLYRDGILVKANDRTVTGRVSDGNNQIEIAKQKCLKLGFKEKTEKFGICVLEFIN